MKGRRTTWPIVAALTVLSAPLVVTYLYLFIDTVTITPAGAIIPHSFSLDHWSFLWHTPRGRPNKPQPVNELAAPARSVALLFMLAPPRRIEAGQTR